MIAEGKTYAEMSRQFGVPEGTMRARVTRMRKQVGARNRPHLIAICYRARLLTEYPASLKEKEA